MVDRATTVAQHIKLPLAVPALHVKQSSNPGYSASDPTPANAAGKAVDNSPAIFHVQDPNGVPGSQLLERIC